MNHRTEVRQTTASPIDWQGEAKYLRELLVHRNDRIARLEKALADALAELRHWHSALNLNSTKNLEVEK